MFFVDTNVFLRFLTADDQSKAMRCKQLFNKAQKGEIALFTSDLVVAELVWILQSPKHYNLSPPEIKDLLLPLLVMKNLHLPNKEIYASVFELFCSTDIDYIDAFHAILMGKHKIKNVFSYHQYFDKIEGVLYG